MFISLFYSPACAFTLLCLTITKQKVPIYACSLHRPLSNHSILQEVNSSRDKSKQTKLLDKIEWLKISVCEDRNYAENIKKISKEK